jgi:hypothetical protein
LIAGEVSEPIVVGLEMVDIAEQDGDLLAGLAPERPVHRQIVRQGSAVAEPGERVMARILDESLVEAVQLGLALDQAG